MPESDARSVGAWLYHSGVPYTPAGLTRAAVSLGTSHVTTGYYKPQPAAGRLHTLIVDDFCAVFSQNAL